MEQVCAFSQDNGVVRRADFTDVVFLRQAQPQPAVLPDRVADDAVVPAENAAAFVHKIAGLRLFAGAQLDDFRVIAIRHEADVLTVGLVGVDEIRLACQISCLGFPQLAEREERPRQPLLRHVVEHVALVLRLVERLAQLVLPVFKRDARIVPGRDVVAAENFRPLIKLVELHIAVAVDAGVRRESGFVGTDKFIDDFLSEIVGEIEDIVGDAELVADASGVLDIVERAACVRARYAGVFVVIELHRRADALVAVLAQKPCRDA